MFRPCLYLKLSCAHSPLARLKLLPVWHWAACLAPHFTDPQIEQIQELLTTIKTQESQPQSQISKFLFDMQFL